MSSAGILYQCNVAARRLADAKTISELETEWVTAQQAFQKSWERSGHYLLLLIHDDYAEISDADATNALTAINRLDKSVPVDVVLHTHGGELGPALQIAEVLVHRRRTAAFVPIFAHSGGTLIALSTQRIHLARGAALGPLDLQMRTADYQVSARHLIEIAEQLGDDADVGLKIAAREARLALDSHAKDVCAVVNRAHKGFMGRRGCDLANKLTKGDMLHSRGINLSVAKKLRVNVTPDMPKSVYALINTRLTQLRRLRELQREQHFVETRQ
jgi:membrane-bound ClpP family serine protease